MRLRLVMSPTGRSDGLEGPVQVNARCPVFIVSTKSRYLSCLNERFAARQVTVCQTVRMLSRTEVLSTVTTLPDIGLLRTRTASVQAGPVLPPIVPQAAQMTF